VDPPLGVWIGVAAVAALGWVIATIRNTMLSERLRRVQQRHPEQAEQQRAPDTQAAGALDQISSGAKAERIPSSPANGARHEDTAEEQVAALLRVRRAETIAALYRRLSRLQWALARPTALVDASQPTCQSPLTAEELGTQFLEYFDENRILLDDELCVAVDRFAARLRDTWLCFRGAPGVEPDTEASTGLTPGRLAWRSAWRALDQDIPALRGLLERRIRPLLADAELAHATDANGMARTGHQTPNRELGERDRLSR
jgi:hypothetical protein